MSHHTVGVQNHVCGKEKLTKHSADESYVNGAGSSECSAQQLKIHPVLGYMKAVYTVQLV
jgi:hypothetical protein